MIDRDELRPNNWVHVHVEGKDGEMNFNAQIKQLLPNEVILANGLHAAYRMLYPIQVTEDILLRCPDIRINPNAFINDRETPPDETIYFLGTIKLVKFGYAKWKAEYHTHVNILNDPLILYVHELQNLYFNQTGNLLNLNI